MEDGRCLLDVIGDPDALDLFLDQPPSAEVSKSAKEQFGRSDNLTAVDNTAWPFKQTAVDLNQHPPVQLNQQTPVQLNQQSAVKLNQQPVVQLNQQSTVKLNQPSAVQLNQQSLVHLQQQGFLNQHQQEAIQLNQQQLLQLSQQQAIQLNQQQAIQINQQPTMQPVLQQFNQQQTLQLNQQQALQLNQQQAIQLNQQQAIQLNQQQALQLNAQAIQLNQGAIRLNAQQTIQLNAQQALQLNAQQAIRLNAQQPIQLTQQQAVQLKRDLPASQPCVGQPQLVYTGTSTTVTKPTETMASLCQQRAIQAASPRVVAVASPALAVSPKPAASPLTAGMAASPHPAQTASPMPAVSPMPAASPMPAVSPMPVVNQPAHAPQLLVPNAQLNSQSRMPTVVPSVTSGMGAIGQTMLLNPGVVQFAGYAPSQQPLQGVMVQTSEGNKILLQQPGYAFAAPQLVKTPQVMHKVTKPGGVTYANAAAAVQPIILPAGTQQPALRFVNLPQGVTLVNGAAVPQQQTMMVTMQQLQQLQQQQQQQLAARTSQPLQVNGSDGKPSSSKPIFMSAPVVSALGQATSMAQTQPIIPQGVHIGQQSVSSVAQNVVKLDPKQLPSVAQMTSGPHLSSMSQNQTTIGTVIPLGSVAPSPSATASTSQHQFVNVTPGQLAQNQQASMAQGHLPRVSQEQITSMNDMRTPGGQVASLTHGQLTNVTPSHLTSIGHMTEDSQKPLISTPGTDVLQASGQSVETARPRVTPKSDVVIAPNVNIQTLGLSRQVPAGAKFQSSSSSIALRLQQQIQLLSRLPERNEQQQRMLDQLLGLQQQLIAQRQQQQQQNGDIPVANSQATTVSAVPSSVHTCVTPSQCTVVTSSQTPVIPSTAVKPPPSLVPANLTIQQKMQALLAQLPAEMRTKLSTQLSCLSLEQQQQLYAKYETAVIARMQANKPVEKATNEVTAPPAKPAIAIKPPTKTQMFLQQLSRDRLGATRPDVNTPFRSKRESVKRLLRYHVMQTRLDTPERIRQGDVEFDEICERLLETKRQLLNKYRMLVWQESGCIENNLKPSVELVMLGRTFLADERANLERERQMARDHPELFVPRPLMTANGDSPLQEDEARVECTPLSSPVQSPTGQFSPKRGLAASPAEQVSDSVSDSWQDDVDTSTCGPGRPHDSACDEHALKRARVHDSEAAPFERHTSPLPFDRYVVETNDDLTAEMDTAVAGLLDTGYESVQYWTSDDGKQEDSPWCEDQSAAVEDESNEQEGLDAAIQSILTDD